MYMLVVYLASVFRSNGSGDGNEGGKIASTLYAIPIFGSGSMSRS